MLSNIKRVFDRAKREKRIALVPFVTAGDPTLAETERLVGTLAQNGADIVELGVPFSDPLADGPTIQRASERSLKKGTTLEKILQCVKSIRRRSDIPLVLMSYYNPILKMGLGPFSRGCKEAGVDGVVIPDLPPEEASQWIQSARQTKLATIFLIAPTSTPERIKKIAQVSRGFIYYVSLTGVTGIRRKVQKDIHRKLKQISAVTELPICVGFGISKPEHVKQLVKEAQGAIVGSALVDLIDRNLKNDLQGKAGNFIRLLKKATYQ